MPLTSTFRSSNFSTSLVAIIVSLQTLTERAQSSIRKPSLRFDERVEVRTDPPATLGFVRISSDRKSSTPRDLSPRFLRWANGGLLGRSRFLPASLLGKHGPPKLAPSVGPDSVGCCTEFAVQGLGLIISPSSFPDGARIS